MILTYNIKTGIWCFLMSDDFDDLELYSVFREIAFVLHLHSLFSIGLLFSIGF